MARAAALLCVLAVAACGGSQTAAPPTAPSAPAAPAPPVTSTATITITSANLFQPSEVRILAGGRVTFVNQNTRARNCGFHDHMQENNPDLRGSIII